MTVSLQMVEKMSGGYPRNLSSEVASLSSPCDTALSHRTADVVRRSSCMQNDEYFSVGPVNIIISASNILSNRKSSSLKKEQGERLHCSLVFEPPVQQQHLH